MKTPCWHSIITALLLATLLVPVTCGAASHTSPEQDRMITPLQLCIWNTPRWLAVFPQDADVSGLMLDLPFGSGHTLRGLDIGIASAFSNRYGISTLLTMSGSDSAAGITVAGLSIGGAQDIAGVSVAGLATGGKSVQGLSVNGLGVIADSFHGVALNGVGFFSRDMSGFALSGFESSAQDINGVSLAGLLTFCRDLKGIQGFSAFNFARTVSGLQIGVYNKCVSGGLQIGVINCNENSPLTWCPFFNFSSISNIPPATVSSDATLR